MKDRVTGKVKRIGNGKVRIVPSIVMAISKQLERGDRREEGERFATHQGKRSKGGRNQKEAKPFSPVTCSLVAYR